MALVQSIIPGSEIMLTIIGALILGVVLWVAFDLMMAGLFLLLANVLMWWHRREQREVDCRLNE